MAINRLFAVRPSEIFEHPTDLPTDPALIPTGTVRGWEAYAVDFGFRRADGGLIYGPFVPAVERRGDVLAIVSRRRSEGDDDVFYFGPGSDFRFGEADRPGPAWYQSGVTLRFIRVRGT